MRWLDPSNWMYVEYGDWSAPWRTAWPLIPSQPIIPTSERVPFAIATTDARPQSIKWTCCIGLFGLSRLSRTESETSSKEGERRRKSSALSDLRSRFPSEFFLGAMLLSLERARAQYGLSNVGAQKI